ncbi:MAG: transposase [Gammaproteobacteria bacterium]|nr:transposase [Gammaproteobacteria bacterium]
MSNGLLDLSVWQLVMATLLLTHVTIAAVTIFLHRAQAHRAVELHPAVSHFLRFWLWLTTGMVTREWVAIHRKHHATCETEEDPHSPQTHGIHTLLWRGAELYRDASHDEAMLARYGRGTPDDWLERRVYGVRPNWGVGAMLVTDVLLFGPLGLTVWAVQMIWIPFWAAGVINGLGHWWGYRNFETDDAATNIVPWAVLIGGEELHNNHHAAPGSARLSARWFEFDVGWAYIRLLQALGLARVRQDAYSQARKAVGDLPPAAVLDKRFIRDVVLPIVREERSVIDRAGRRLRRRARWLLLRQKSRLDAWQRDQLEQLLQASGRLRTAYESRQRLAEIWRRAAGDLDSVRREFREWCQHAEQSGVARLSEFALRLRGQLLQPGAA